MSMLCRLMLWLRSDSSVACQGASALYEILPAHLSHTYICYGMLSQSYIICGTQAVFHISQMPYDMEHDYLILYVVYK